jgi:imidazolonepropionase-like amidohydrolase
MFHRYLLIVLVLNSLSSAAEDPKTCVAYRGCRILTAAGAPIQNGVLVVRNGKIAAVGPVDATTIPPDATVRDLSGKTIIPGLVDTHSHIGVYPRPHVPGNADGNEMSGPVQSGLRALDAIYPDDPGVRMAVAGGITTANIMPGSGNVIGGQTLYVKLRGQTIEDMRIADAPVVGGLKMANGDNPKGYGKKNQAPVTRMKVAALQREQFAKARDYQRQWAAYRKAVAEGKEKPQPDRDLALEPLVEVLERKRTVHFHSHRADDLMTAVRLSEEFGFELVIQHGTDAYRIADELARRKIPVSMTLIDSPGGKLEVAGMLEENGAILEKAGVTVAINTDDFITESRFFLRTGAIAVRGGMSEASALRALTLHGAKLMHLDHRLGSLETGKDADFVVLSGPPFSIYTQVLETYIDGVRRYSRLEQQDWLYQAGGFAVPTRERLPQPPALVTARTPAAAPSVDPAARPTQSKPPRLIVYAGRIHTVGKGTIENGAILIENGMLRYIGPRDQFKAPDGVPALTANEVTPGLIDAHTVVGLSGPLNVPGDQDQDENSDPNQADLRVYDGFNPGEALLDFFRQQGVTVIHAMPGRANVIAGQTGVFRTAGSTTSAMALRFPAGVLVNLGEIPKQTYAGKLPTTRMGTASLVRGILAQAQGYARKLSTTDEDKRPPRNLKLEALEPVVNGKIPMIFSAHRADDIATGLRLAQEFKIEAMLDLATEGYLIAEQIAERKVPVVVHPTMQRVGSNLETYHSHLCNAALLAERKVPLAIGTAFEGYVPKTRVLRYEAAMALVNALGWDRALRAITLDAARILKIDDRYGSLETGKVADLVLYDGDPFEHSTHVTYTLSGGRIVYDRAEYLKLPYSRRALPLIGGAGVGCCLGIW